MLVGEKQRIAEYLNGCLKEFEKDESREYIDGFSWAVECIATFFSEEDIFFDGECFRNIIFE